MGTDPRRGRPAIAVGRSQLRDRLPERLDCEIDCGIDCGYGAFAGLLRVER